MNDLDRGVVDAARALLPAVESLLGIEMEPGTWFVSSLLSQIVGMGESPERFLRANREEVLRIVTVLREDE